MDANRGLARECVPPTGVAMAACWSSISPQAAVIRREIPDTGAAGRHTRTAGLQAPCDPSPSPTLCLPCRRSWVRIPSAALEKTCFLQAFCMRRRLVRLRRVGVTPDSPRADHRPFQDNALFAGRFWFVRTEVILRGLQQVGCSPAAAVTPTRTGRHDPADSARRRDPSGRDSWGQSGFSPETRRSTSARSAATSSEPWHPEP
jgi:hypothetical protein